MRSMKKSKIRCLLLKTIMSEMKNILDKINDRIYIAKKNNELEDRAIKKNSNMTQRNKTPKKMNNFKA